MLWWSLAWFPLYFYSDCPWPCCVIQNLERRNMSGSYIIYILYPIANFLQSNKIICLIFVDLTENSFTLTMVFCFQNCSDLLWEKLFLWSRKTAKGQLISKCLCGIFNSSNKQTKKFDLTTMALQVELFLFIFQNNWKHQKDISKFTDLSLNSY